MADKQYPYKGAWGVDLEGRIGICAHARMVDANGDFAGWKQEFHYVNKDTGTTTLVVEGWEGTRKAARAELPAARVGHLSDEELAALGYV